MKKINYLGYEILNEPYSHSRNFISSGSVLTISPNSYGLGTKIPELDEALKSADIIVLDGVYFALGYFLKTGKTIKKNQGPNIFYDELKIQNSRKGRIFFLGSTEETLARIGARLEKEYTDIEFQTFSPPFKKKLGTEDNDAIANAIKSFGPDVVMVGMTCPKQEIWIREQIDCYPGILFMAIGGVFDWFAGNYKELHPLWWKLRLGWLGRAIQRPELLMRNLPNYWIYFKNMLVK
mgnify:CR=1 FL=1